MLMRFIATLFLFLITIVVFKIFAAIGFGIVAMGVVLAGISALYGTEDPEIEQEVKDFKELINSTKDTVKDEFVKGPDSKYFKRFKDSFLRVRFNAVKALKILTKEEYNNDKCSRRKEKSNS